jgi:hypothetical protein
MNGPSTVNSRKIIFLLIFTVLGFSLGHALRMFLRGPEIIPVAALAAYVAVRVLNKIR